MPASTLTTKGQVTIPKAVRSHLGLETGDRIAFLIREDGVVEIQPETVDLRSLLGIVKPKVRGVTVEDMKKTVRKMGSRG
jgi:AbrB family looped-hinge helix DNA binding protein